MLNPHEQILELTQKVIHAVARGSFGAEKGCEHINNLMRVWSAAQSKQDSCRDLRLEIEDTKQKLEKRTRLLKLAEEDAARRKTDLETVCNHLQEIVLLSEREKGNRR